MAWTNPRTWVTDELVTAAMLNAHIRDNLLAVQHLHARKASDTVRTTTTFIADTAFDLAVAANEVWLVQYFFVAFGNQKLGVRFTFPSGGQAGGVAIGIGEDSAIDAASTSPTPGRSFFLGSAVGAPMRVTMHYVNGGTAGTLGVETRCEVAGSVTVKTNSSVWAAKLA